MEAEPSVLTKFTKFYDSYFSLDQPKVKISLASEFNDIFDSQIYPDRNSVLELSHKHRIDPESINFLAKRISNSAHILSLSGKCALDVDTANMWGIYADNGKGIALEFDYKEIAERFNSCYTNLLVKKFAEIDKRINIFGGVSIEKVKRQALLEKLEFAKTKVGKMALINIYSNIISTNNGKKFRDIYDGLLSGNVTDVAVESISPIIDATLQRPEGSGLFLHRIEYIENNIDWLYKSLDSALERERLFYDKQYFPEKHVDIDRNIANFYLRKSQIWTYESEYRIISPYFFHRDYGQVKKGCLNDHIMALNNFIGKNEGDKYFYKMSDSQIERTDDCVDGGAVGLINMPFPKKIYLGWEFNDSKQLKIIEQFCIKHQSIELVKLKKFFDNKNKQFAIA